MRRSSCTTFTTSTAVSGPSEVHDRKIALGVAAKISRLLCNDGTVYVVADNSRLTGDISKLA